MADRASQMIDLLAVGISVFAWSSSVALETATTTTITAVSQPERTLQNAIVVVFDVETTGLNPKRDRIIELAAVRIHNSHVVDRQSWLINPGIPVPPSTQRIHGISTDMLSGAPPFSLVYTQFIAFARESILLSHNARFDRSFLLSEIQRCGLQAPVNPLYDTLGIFKRFFPSRRSYTLEGMIRDLCPDLVPPEGAEALTSSNARLSRFHSALWDAECTAALIQRLIHALPGSVSANTFLSDGKPCLPWK